MRRAFQTLPLTAAALLTACATTRGPGIEPAPAAVSSFAQRVSTLASDDFGGREPGTPGIERAATFIEKELATIGITPFNGYWRQPFDVSGELEVRSASFEYEAPGVAGKLKLDEQFAPLGISGEGTSSGTLAFVGYGLEDGPNNYTSFGDTDDLAGKIAILLRFEPLDENGKSRWNQRDEGWTNAAGLRAKFDNVISRNPAGIIFVAPPGVDDARAAVLPTARSTRFGDRVNVPVVSATTEAVDRLIQLADHDARSLMDLRKAADTGEITVVDLSAATVTLDVSMDIDTVQTANVAGVLPGRGTLANQWVIIGAHYDHLGLGHVGTSRAPKAVGKEIHHGADDNASGVAGVLQTAETLKKRYDLLPDNADARSVLFLFFSAEEMGLLGSKAFVEDSILSADDVTAMLNLDMIGRLRHNKLTVSGTGTAQEFEGMLTGYWDTHGFNADESKSGLGPSDHASFYRGGIPVLALFTGLHTDYHKPSDTADKVNPTGGARIAALVADLAYDLALKPENLTFVKAGAERRQGPSRRSGVSLGFMPGSYDESERGALIGEVLPDSPALRAGLKDGDRIIAWNGEEIANIFSYMQALSGHKPGDTVRITIERDGKEVEIEATLGSSDRTR